MNSIWQDIRNAFSPGGSALMRLIVANVAVFLLLCLLWVLGIVPVLAGLQSRVASYLMMPALFGEYIYRPWTIVTYFFTHTEPFHILFNMLVLYWFGQIVQEYLGNRRLLTVYFLGGIAGGLLYLAGYAFVPQWAFDAQHTRYALLGASGAVYAVVLAAATVTPNYTFFLFLLGPVRIVYIAAFYVLLSFIELRTQPGGNLAHLGGAALGFLYIKGLRSGTDLGGWFWKMWDWIATPRAGRMTVSHRANTPKASNSRGGKGDSSQDEIDAILDKINRVGYEKLTREEKEKLFSAGQENQ